MAEKSCACAALCSGKRRDIAYIFSLWFVFIPAPPPAVRPVDCKGIKDQGSVEKDKGELDVRNRADPELRSADWNCLLIISQLRPLYHSPGNPLTAHKRRTCTQ